MTSAPVLGQRGPCGGVSANHPGALFAKVNRPELPTGTGCRRPSAQRYPLGRKPKRRIRAEAIPAATIAVSVSQLQ